jgi:sorting nexin-29
VVGEGQEQGHILFGSKVKTAAKNYYEQLYKTEYDSAPHHLLNNSDKVVTESDNAMLVSDYTVEELFAITQTLPNGKEVGVDGLPYELFKYSSYTLRQWLVKFINKCRKSNYFPNKFKQGQIFLIYKKGNPYEVCNYRPITLLNTAYKLYTAMINSRLIAVVESKGIYGNEQGGFRKHRVCNQKIKIVCNLIDDANAHGGELHTMAIDFEKAFDSISHTAILKSLKDYSFSDTFVHDIKLLYEDCTSNIITGQGITQGFKVGKGVCQGDTISPTLFNLFINTIARVLKISHRR